jgi:hypothetical protein
VLLHVSGNANYQELPALHGGFDDALFLAQSYDRINLGGSPSWNECGGECHCT